MGTIQAHGRMLRPWPLTLFTGPPHPSEPLQTFEEGLGCSPVVTEHLQVVLANKTPSPEELENSVLSTLPEGPLHPL